MKVLLIDGYNIIHAWPELAGALEWSLEEARERLITSLMPLADLGSFQVILVFDAGSADNPVVSMEMRANLQVLFTGRGQSADALIEELSRKLVEHHSVIIASDDRASSGLSFLFGASVMSAQQLSREVRRAREEISSLSRELERAGRRPRLEERIDQEIRQLLDEMRFR
jgi:hypothetical protein